MSEPRQSPDPADAPREEVPPGREGADSAAADAVRVDPDGTAEIPDRSHGNDIPGVGPREPGSDNEPPIQEQMEEYRSSRPNALKDETGGAPHLNAREMPPPEEE